ncbi:phenylacetic acid degradation operon negative regulatory protein [Sesbania bispinosa]|nr:phenylacetic acid degradation operon negative regulatory protein [Sesbania bispinosa]
MPLSSTPPKANHESQPASTDASTPLFMYNFREENNYMYDRFKCMLLWADFGSSACSTQSSSSSASPPRQVQQLLLQLQQYFAFRPKVQQLRSSSSAAPPHPGACRAGAASCPSASTPSCNSNSLICRGILKINVHLKGQSV